jgi:hypothetical protein
MISIIIPVIRPEKAAVCIEAIKRNAITDDYEIIVDQDTDGIGCPKMVERLVAKTKGDLVMFLGDDTIPEPGFMESAVRAMNTLPDGWGVVGLRTQDDRMGEDGFNPRAHWMAHKKMLDYIPGGNFFSAEFHHCFGDDELQDIAVEMGRWAFAEDCRILHDHYINNKAKNPWDEGYQKAYDNGAYEADWKTYHRRKIQRRGFRVGVGMPETGTKTDRRFSSSYRQAIYSYLKLDDAPPIKEYEPTVPIGEFARDIAHNRNDLIKMALMDGVSHLIMMDTDQIYPQDILIKLIAWAARGKDCVIAPVHRRYEPFEMILMRGEDPDHYSHVPDEECYSGKMIEVDAGGAGCFMVSMLAVLELVEPWFTLDAKTPSGEDMGEDIGFFWNLRRNGVQIWADTSIEIDHLAEIVINREFREIWKRLTRRGLNT